MQNQTSFSIMGPFLSRRGKSTQTSAVLGLCVRVYDKSHDGDTLDLSELNGSTAEKISEHLVIRLDMSPPLMHCFGLYVCETDPEKRYWLAPGDRVLSGLENRNVYFRMRFLPAHDKVQELVNLDASCAKYLFYQIKWDFLHGNLSIVVDRSKEEEIRGLTVILIFIMMRIETEENDRNYEQVKQFFQEFHIKKFFPLLLKKKSLVDRHIMSGSIKTNVQSYNCSYPRDSAKGHYTYFMKSFIGLNIRENVGYRHETYSAWELKLMAQDGGSHDEAERQVVLHVEEKQKVMVTVEMVGKCSQLKIEDSQSVSLLVVILSVLMSLTGLT